MEQRDVIVIGGGAAGFFAALTAKQKYPLAKVTLLEKSGALLSKVRISGGGRCNVTHAAFEPLPLSQNYPRGRKELVGPFHHFQPQDTIAWFESRGVHLKTESDGRCFPTSDSSQTIIDCLLGEASRLGVEIVMRQKALTLVPSDQGWVVNDAWLTPKVILATGSSPEGYELAKALGHTIVPPIPSLFTFNVPNSPLEELSGVSFERVGVKVEGFDREEVGALLITHFGFSGPAVLKLSAFGARFLHEKNYHFEILINWLPDLPEEAIVETLLALKQKKPSHLLNKEIPFHFPKSFWQKKLGILGERRLGDHSHRELKELAAKLHRDPYSAQGKTTHKEEFVTCGGVSLKEVNFKTMESKLKSGLFFAGELLDIDGITGGFNFQNAWTTGFLAGS